jgi:hypothetical protein
MIGQASRRIAAIRLTTSTPPGVSVARLRRQLGEIAAIAGASVVASAPPWAISTPSAVMA